MSRLRPRALDCPSCGASVEVKHAVKAKSVVCGTCTAQIDLTKPGFEVLAKPGRRAAAPFGPIRLGMRATIDDRAHEVIGRLRLGEIDEGEESLWDEWLLLREDGAYRWIAEEPGGGWSLNEPFVPETPVTPAELVEGGRVRIGGKRLLVRERGTATIRFLEGELTWKARVGDTVEYADATLGTHGYAFEWSEDEFESFTIATVTRSQLWEMFGLAAARPAATAHHDRAARLRRTGAILFGSALVAFAVGLAAPIVGGAVSRSDGVVPLSKADVQSGVRLAEMELERGMGFYELAARADMPRGMDRYDLELVGPGDVKATLLRFEHVGTAHAAEEARARFTVPTTGTWRVVLRGAEKGPAQAGSVRWELYRRLLVGRWFHGAGIVLLLAALYTFFRAGKEAMVASSLYFGDEEA